MKLITERNLEIYAAHENGMSYEKIGKKYFLSAERIRQICNDVKRGKYNPSSLFSILDKHYPNLSTRTTHGAVYVIYRYVNRVKNSRPEYTLENLLRTFNSIPESDYIYIRNMGKKKLSFLEQLNEDHKAGRI